MKSRLNPQLRAFILGALLITAPVMAKEMSVQIQKAPLKKTPGVFSPTTSLLTYGDRVEVLAEENDWIEVRFEQKNGWLHKSSLTKKMVKLKAGEGDVAAAASDDELALAGKGFSAEVEAEYKSRNPDADFAILDKAEGLTYTPEELRKFLMDGGLLEDQ